MPLTPGTRLGPYEIVAPLGAGGMGEVYRARDSRLGREVAVKVLPQHLTAHPEPRARCEREARSVSSLNHPHICTLHDVGREGDTDYLVMELVDGETLAQRLLKGPIPAPDVLRFGAQIADALDRAHRAGVVHRDLKPGNVMLTRSGAKLMDFGLARTTGLAGAGSQGMSHSAMTTSPTVAQALTTEGSIVGTFQYMSPEQLEGGEADARSDLWALGCVLYEMATGRRAFDGRSQASLITAIMGSDPAPLSLIAPMSPPALERVVNACLAKDPADRIQSAHDVKLQLGWISEPASTSGVASGVHAPAAKPLRTSSRERWSLAVGLLGLMVAAVAGGVLLARRSPVVVTEVPAPSDLQLSGYWSAAAISPDGSMVAGVATRRSDAQLLWLWHLDSATPVAMPGTEGAFFVSWSPDGRSIGYASMSAKGVFRVAASGGSPTKLAELSDGRGLSWGRKNVIVYAPAPSGPLMKVSASGGTPEPATALDASRGEAGHRFPSFLPDGEHFLFVVMPPGPHGFTIRVGSLGSTRSQPLMTAESGASYVAPGYLVFVQNGKLTAQRFDAGGMKLVGERFTLDDAPIVSDMDAETVGSASRDGRLLYLVSRPADARLEWLDRTGASRGVIALPEGDWAPQSISPDQTSALATRDGDLWRVDLQRAVPARLMRGVNPTESAVWSPDGQRVAATDREAGHEVIRLLNAGGSGAADSVTTVPALFTEAMSWAPDGQTLLISVLGRLAHGADVSGSWDLWTVPLDGGPAKPYLATPAFERLGKLSPDGRWAACVSRFEGKIDLFIDSYPVPGHRVQLFTGEPQRDIRVMWGRQGRELLYSNIANELVSVPLTVSGAELRAGEPAPVFKIPDDVGAMRTRDGERFLVMRQNQASPGPSLRLVQNWTGLARK